MPVHMHTYIAVRLSGLEPSQGPNLSPMIFKCTIFREGRQSLVVIKGSSKRYFLQQY